MVRKKGKSTYIFENQPVITGYGAVVGKKEGQGPYGKYFDFVGEDERFGEDGFEKAESTMQKMAVVYALDKAKTPMREIDAICSGDLLNQCIGSSFAVRDMNIPFIGIYGACSTMALSMILVSMMIEGGGMKNGISSASSHFCAAERQYRFPLEYGCQRTPTAQWTVTGAGAFVISEQGKGPKIVAATFGEIKDLGITDQNNMGAAMAPAACSTILRFLKDTETKAEDYDAIYTGDLGLVGSELLIELAEKEGYDLSKRHKDFGKMIYDMEKQDVHAGGSGCGCSASMMASYIMQEMNKGKLKNILYCATGALLSPTSVLQGESIPSICHLVNIRCS